MTTRVRKSVAALSAHDLGSYTRAEIRELVAATIPVGMCFVWNGTANDVPEGYMVCNGKDGKTPNLTNRTAIGAGGTFPLNSTGGKYNFDIRIEGTTDGHSLGTNEVPPHTHTYQAHSLGNKERTGKKSRDAASKKTQMYLTSTEQGNELGKADPHSHDFNARLKHEAIGPYVSKYWIMRVAGAEEPEDTPVNFKLSARTRVTKRLADLKAADCDMYTAAEISQLVTALLPTGCIAPWWGDVRQVPAGWRVLDGQGGREDYRDRMIIGAGGNYPWNSKGGSITVDYTQTAEVTKTELFGRHLPEHNHRYEVQRLNRGVRVESDKGNMKSVKEKSARFRPKTYRTGYAQSGGKMWGNALGGVDPHFHTYTLTYIHKCMTPFYALHWLIKVEGD